MTRPIITVEHLSKRYHLGQIGATTLRESVERFIGRLKRPMQTLDPRHETLDRKGVSAPFSGSLTSNVQSPKSSSSPSLTSNVYSLKSDDPQDLWALKDVSFEVQPGEVLGIIGRNGAGKSTLLKILSRITEPASGRAIIRGRVASLLEVGTGFHPELTGRENIFLNGAILGMKKVEIALKFDEIVAFAGVERFIDTPVKRYSSGMYVRLAFAVAAHLEPEILVVDEVLAVGDMDFQKKCLGKMEQVAQGGRTVLFVSHNMGAIRELCSHAIRLEKGMLVEYGRGQQVVQDYISCGAHGRLLYINESPSGGPRINRAALEHRSLSPESVRIDERLMLIIEVDTQGMKDLMIGVIVSNAAGVVVHHSSDEFCTTGSLGAARLRYCEFPPYAFGCGPHTISLSLSARNREMYQHEINALGFTVEFVGKVADRTQGCEWKGACGPGLPVWHG